jgi:hypothetical protein
MTKTNNLRRAGRTVLVVICALFVGVGVAWAYPPVTWPCPQDGEAASLTNAQVVYMQSCKGTAYNATYSHTHFENGKSAAHSFVVQWCDSN